MNKRKRETLRKKTCTGKIKHKDRRAAIAEIYNTKCTDTLNAYKCQFCGGWHVGHLTKKYKQWKKRQ